MAQSCKQRAQLLEQVWTGNLEMMKQMYLFQYRNSNLIEQNDIRQMKSYQDSVEVAFRDYRAKIEDLRSRCQDLEALTQKQSHENLYLRKKGAKLDKLVTSQNDQLLESNKKCNTLQK